MKMKYHNKKVATDDGLKFDSKKEYNRYLQLRQMEEEGLVNKLERQVRFSLLPNNDKYRGVSYIADFVYYDSIGVQHIEDVKGLITPEFKIKQKLFYHFYHKEIEIYK